MAQCRRGARALHASALQPKLQLALQRTALLSDSVAATPSAAAIAERCCRCRQTSKLKMLFSLLTLSVAEEKASEKSEVKSKAQNSASKTIMLNKPSEQTVSREQ